MANFNEFSHQIMQFLILLFVFSCVRANQRRFSPLLVEDDGSRNNRPAGKCFYLYIEIFKNKKSKQIFLSYLLIGKRNILQKQLTINQKVHMFLMAKYLNAFRFN